MSVILSHGKAIRRLQQTAGILERMLRGFTQEQAQTARDGAEGWTILEIACHLRDIEQRFYRRARQFVEQERPQFAPSNQDDLVAENDYAHQKLNEVVTDFLKTRAALIRYLSAVPETSWQRTALHPYFGEHTLLEHAFNIALHDVDHIDQIYKAIEYDAAQRKAAAPKPTKET